MKGRVGVYFLKRAGDGGKPVKGSLSKMVPEFSGRYVGRGGGSR